MTHFTPYLLFDGNCADAMELYKSCLGGELMLTKVLDSIVKDQMPKEIQDKIMHAHF